MAFPKRLTACLPKRQKSILSRAGGIVLTYYTVFLAYKCKVWYNITIIVNITKRGENADSNVSLQGMYY